MRERDRERCACVCWLLCYQITSVSGNCGGNRTAATIYKKQGGSKIKSINCSVCSCSMFDQNRYCQKTQKNRYISCKENCVYVCSRLRLYLGVSPSTKDFIPYCMERYINCVLFRVFYITRDTALVLWRSVRLTSFRPLLQPSPRTFPYARGRNSIHGAVCFSTYIPIREG